MQVIISGQVADSSATPENGRIEFAQAQRMDTGELLVTGSPAIAQVVNGELRTLAGGQFHLPHNPEHTAVRVREILGGTTFEWWTAVPEVGSVEYRELPIVQSDDIPESVWGPPPWVAQVEQMRDDTVEAIQEGIDVADALGGLAGIESLVTDAQTAATESATSAGQSASSATTAGTEADRAEAAADAIDMDALNARMDSIETTADGAVQTPVPTPDDETLMVFNSVSEQYAPLSIGSGLSIRNGALESSASSADMVSNLRYPLYIAHRGGALIRPEHSMSAYRFAAESGFYPEPDVFALSDGTLVCIHNSTTGALMTGPSMTVNNMTREQWEEKWIKPPGTTGKLQGAAYEKGVYFTDVLDEFGGKIVIWPEIKDENAAQSVIDAVVERGLQDAVVLQSGNLSIAQLVVANGCRALLGGNTHNPVEVAGSGIEFMTMPLTTSQSYMESCSAQGIKVISYTANTLQQTEDAFSKSAVGVFSDDPWRVSRTRLTDTKLDLDTGNLWPGWSHYRGTGTDPNKGTTQKVEIGLGALDFSTLEEGSIGNRLQLGSFGWGGQTLSIRFWAQAGQARQVNTPEGAHMVGVYLGKAIDDMAVAENTTDVFRYAVIRRDGRKNVYNRAPGSGSTVHVLGTAAESPPNAPSNGGPGDPLQFEMIFTPTSVTVKCLTRPQAVLTATHAAWSGVNDDLYVTLNALGTDVRVWDIHAVRGI